MIALYARQSVERENSVSIETQLDFCRSMIRPDERSQSVTIYRDEGASGGNTNRPGFQKMMKDIRSGKIKKVITYKLDRISRSLYDFVGILETFEEYGVKFVSSQEAFDTDSIYGNLVLKILMVFAEFERTSIINRVRDAYSKRTDLGLYMGGRRQYGYSLKETQVHGIKTKMYEPVAEELEQIEYIFKLYSQPSVSLCRVINNLNDNDIRPLEGSDWTSAKISNLLKNPVYVMADSAVYDYFESRGVRIVNDLSEFDGTRGAFLYGRSTHDAKLGDWSDMKLVLGIHQGVIPSSTWLKCQQKLNKNKQIGNSLANKTSWLAGKLVCSQCGYTMTTAKSQRSDGSYRRYFVCTGKSHRKTCKGIKSTIYVDDMEQLLEQCISEKIKTLGKLRQNFDNEQSTKRNDIELKIKKIEQSQKQLGDMLLQEDINDDLLAIMNRKASELSRQKQQLIEQLNTLSFQSKEIDLALFLSKQWTRAKYDEKKAVAGILIQHVIMHSDGTPEIVWNM